MRGGKVVRCENQRWHGILVWREHDEISWRGILMWREESLFYIVQDIGECFGDNQRGFGLVQRAGSREKCRFCAVLVD